MTLQEEIQYHVTIRSELPGLLAELVKIGKREEAINLLVHWGNRTKVNTEIWKCAKELLKKGGRETESEVKNQWPTVNKKID